MEPNTVGQAPKERPLPEPEQPPAPGYLDQAKAAAASASATVGSTVSAVAGTVVGAVTGNKAQEEKVEESPVRTKSPEEKQLDQKIDASNNTNVEAFLREQNMSKK
jgi:Na+/glutamate symporter